MKFHNRNDIDKYALRSDFQIVIMESWLEMAIAMMKPIMPIVFMMEVTVVEGVSTLTNAHIVCVTMEEQMEGIHHVSALYWLLNYLASKFEQLYQNLETGRISETEKLVQVLARFKLNTYQKPTINSFLKDYLVGSFFTFVLKVR